MNYKIEEIKGHNSVVGHYKKKSQSYLGKIPSKDFWDEAYRLFLDCATPEELETDTLKRETLEKISTQLGF